MTEIQQNRYDRLVRRATNIVGGGSQVNDTLNELFPIIDVENLPAELYALANTRLCAGNTQVQAGAGLRPQLQVFNPAGSGQIMTVTRFIVSSTTDPILSWSIGSAAMTTLGARGSFRDTRFTPAATETSTAELRVQSTAVPIGAVGNARTLALTPLDFADENGLAVLMPGFGFEIESSVVATFLTCSFYWRERATEPSETNF